MPKNYIDQHKMVQCLHHFCEINSGTDNLKGLAAMHALLKKSFTPLACQIETVTFSPTPIITMNGDTILRPAGDALWIQKRPHLKRRVFLSGHMDTVFGENHPFQSLKTIDANTLCGPGVTDMKGGLVVILHALMEFEQDPLAKNLGWDVFINADEETGSLASKDALLQIAKRSQVALVYEGAITQDGVFAKNRKGHGEITLVVTGVSAHAGRDFHLGRNAICHLAKIITDIDALNGKHGGITLNVGKIQGGTAINTVPDKAVAKIDVRLGKPEDQPWIENQLAAILNRHQNTDYTVQLASCFNRPVKHVNAATKQLFSTLSNIGKQLQLKLQWQDIGGCCDGNNLSEAGLAVIDTLGVRGGAIHTPHEFILLDSLAERALLSAMLLKELAAGKLEHDAKDG